MEVFSEVIWDLKNPYRRDSPEFAIIQTIGKILLFKGWEQIRQGNYAKAFDTRENLIKAGKTVFSKEKVVEV